jgi:hypothetical protein
MENSKANIPNTNEEDNAYTLSGSKGIDIMFIAMPIIFVLQCLPIVLIHPLGVIPVVCMALGAIFTPTERADKQSNLDFRTKKMIHMAARQAVAVVIMGFYNFIMLLVGRM